MRNCRWIPACGETTRPHMFNVRNDGMHDFGYPCSMPRTITIDGLSVDDSNHPDDYQGLVLFTDPDDMQMGDIPLPTTADRPFPYEKCRTVAIRGLTTASGKPYHTSTNSELHDFTTVTSA